MLIFFLGTSPFAKRSSSLTVYIPYCTMTSNEGNRILRYLQSKTLCLTEKLTGCGFYVFWHETFRFFRDAPTCPIRKSYTLIKGVTFFGTCIQLYLCHNFNLTA